MNKILTLLLATVGIVSYGEDLPENVFTEVVDGVRWYYTYATSGNSYSMVIIDSEVVIGDCRNSSYYVPFNDGVAIPTNTVGDIVVPSELGGKPVRTIGSSAFRNCKFITSVTIPTSVRELSGSPFYGCDLLRSVVFRGDAPQGPTVYYEEPTIFAGTSRRLVVSVPYGSIGWDGGVTTRLPNSWYGRAIVHVGEEYDWDHGNERPVSSVVMLNVTNTVIHYVMNSVVPTAATPIPSAGFVNVITEIKGGAVAVPDSWSSQYPDFNEKFGQDLGVALTKKSGKKDSWGNDMFVWQDYVAGTDPTDETDVFRASIVLVGGVPKVSYTPELCESEKARRVYTIFGKSSLNDVRWNVVNGDESAYNFFKIAVEMKK